MKPINAIDAISPAFHRTCAVLAQPFRLGYFLKLVIVATFSAANLITMGILFPMQASSLLFQFLMGRRGSSSPSPFAHLAAQGSGPVFFVFLGIGFLIFLLISALLFYIFTRFRFVIFDAVLFGERKFSRSWSKYGSQTARYYGLSILIALGCMLAATTVAAPLIIISLHMLRSGSSAAASGMLGYLMLSMLIEYALIFVAVIVDGLVHDFLLPPMAIEDASIERSFARFTSLLRADFAGVFVFTLMRFVLRMALAIALFFITVIPVVILGLILAVIGFVLYHPLWGAGIGGQVAFGLYAVTAGLLAFVLYMIAIFTAGGIVAVFTQAYALIFYADRYPQLGSILNPPPRTAEILPGSSPAPTSRPDSEPPPFLPEPPALW